jgi:hypothetical protein
MKRPLTDKFEMARLWMMRVVVESLGWTVWSELPALTNLI